MHFLYISIIKIINIDISSVHLIYSFDLSYDYFIHCIKSKFKYSKKYFKRNKKFIKFDQKILKV